MPDLDLEMLALLATQTNQYAAIRTWARYLDGS